MTIISRAIRADAPVVVIDDERLRDGRSLQELYDEIVVLLEGDGKRQLLLDFELVQSIASAGLSMLIRIKNKLTPEQQATLKSLLAQNAALQEKLRKAQALSQQRAIEGRNLSVLEPARIQFESLMQQGKFKEAEAVLDRTLRVLESLK